MEMLFWVALIGMGVVGFLYLGMERLPELRDVEAALAASRGAELLDQIRPDWIWEVDPAALDMAASDHCLLAGLSGCCYPCGLGVIGRSVEEEPEWAVHYGFLLTEPRLQTAYPDLTVAWIHEIAARRQARSQ